MKIVGWSDFGKLFAFIAILVIGLLAGFPYELLADDGVPTSIGVLDRILAAMSGVSGAILAGIAVVVELIFRLIPTSKPLSIAHLIANILQTVGAILTKGGDLLDQVLPQKTK